MSDAVIITIIICLTFIALSVVNRYEKNTNDYDDEERP